MNQIIQNQVILIAKDYLKATEEDKLITRICYDLKPETVAWLVKSPIEGITYGRTDRFNVNVTHRNKIMFEFMIAMFEVTEENDY